MVCVGVDVGVGMTGAVEGRQLNGVGSFLLWIPDTELRSGLRGVHFYTLIRLSRPFVFMTHFWQCRILLQRTKGFRWWLVLTKPKTYLRVHSFVHSFIFN